MGSKKVVITLSLGMLIAVGFVTGCKKKSHDSSTSSGGGQPAPAPAAPVFEVNGTWTGTTSQGKTMSMTIQDKVVVKYAFDMNYPGCASVSSSVNSTTPPIRVSNNAFSDIEGTTPFISGSFSSSSNGHGTIKDSVSFCSGGVQTITWDATKTSSSVSSLEMIAGPTDGQHANVIRIRH